MTPDEARMGWMGRGFKFVEMACQTPYRIVIAAHIHHTRQSMSQKCVRIHSTKQNGNSRRAIASQNEVCGFFALCFHTYTHIKPAIWTVCVSSSVCSMHAHSHLYCSWMYVCVCVFVCVHHERPMNLCENISETWVIYHSLEYDHFFFIGNKRSKWEWRVQTVCGFWEETATAAIDANGMEPSQNCVNEKEIISEKCNIKRIFWHGNAEYSTVDTYPTYVIRSVLTKTSRSQCCSMTVEWDGGRGC